MRLYDREYASTYNGKVLLGPDFKECTLYELSLLKAFLVSSRSWLDVACGTGYFLSRFPEVVRSGLDLAPAMLEQARIANPGATFVEADYRIDIADWHGRWDLVSCMWYAYCYADSVAEVETVMRNLIAWTAPNGTCFVPVFDPDILCKTHISYRPAADSDDGRLEVTGVVWNWIDEPSGRRHTGLIAPHLELLKGLFEPFFRDVRLDVYPRFSRDCLAARKAIIATSKLS